VVAVDDGSTDGSAALLAAHAAREPRLRVIRTGPEGLVPALETARAVADTPYLARMDADDVAHPDRFLLQAGYLKHHPEVAVVGCKVRIFPRDDIGGGWERYETWLNGLLAPEDHAREIFVESPLAHPSVMMRTGVLADLGGYRDPDWPEDYDLWLRFHAAGHGLAKVDRVLLAWRNHPERISTTTSRYDLDAFLRCRAHHLAAHPALAGGRVRIWGAGRTGRRLARELARNGIAVEAFYEVARNQIGRLRRGAPIRFWEELGPPDGIPLLVAVGAPGARELIRPALRERGWVEGETAFFAS
jgi:glycosyltransferase involved in cell wall biosynthesis